MDRPVEVSLPVPAAIIEQVVADWVGSIVIFNLKPGIYGAVGVDGDIVEALTGIDRDRWTAVMSDKKTFRVFPILAAELEDPVIATLQESEFDAVVIEDMKRKEN